MTFASRENSRSLGAPIGLFRFTVGSTVYGYTNAEQTISYAGVDYIPAPTDRDAVVSSGTLDKASLKITLPITTAIAELFRIYPPSDVVGMTIFAAHGGDTDYKAVWSGRVLSCSRAGYKATFSCEPVSTSMKRPGLRKRYQRSCMHRLYGDKCKANQAAFTTTGSVTEVDGAYIAFADGWNGAFDSSRFENGIVTVDGNIRTILRVLPENTLLVSSAITGLSLGDTVALSLGCEHSMDACRGFGNILNFGGQPWIPTQNPISSVNIFF